MRFAEQDIADLVAPRAALQQRSQRSSRSSSAVQVIDAR